MEELKNDFLNKIDNLLTITPIYESNKQALLIFIIASLALTLLMLILSVLKKIKNPHYFAFFVAFLAVIYLFQLKNNDEKAKLITIKDGFYQNIKNKNIVIQDYFSVKEREMIKFCLEKHEKETGFYICLKVLVKEEQNSTNLLKTKENNQEIINQFNVE